MHEVFLQLYDRYRMLFQLGYITGHQVNEKSQVGNSSRTPTILILNLGPTPPPQKKKEKKVVIKKLLNKNKGSTVPRALYITERKYKI